MSYALADETLYETCTEVLRDQDVCDLVEGMKKVMHEGKGVGIAANQVGSLLRVIIINTRDFKKVILNPVITKRCCGIVKSVERCLSFPGRLVAVERDKQITIEGYNLNWTPFKQKLRGQAGICVQHEVDHLNGKIFEGYVINE